MAPSASPFSLDLLSPTATHPSSSSSLSLYFLPPLPQTLCANTFRAPKFRLYCSHHTNTQQINPTKKKRKPRPSFVDQIQDKWSLKTTSMREKFPWQEREQKREPIDEEQSQASSGIVVSESENENPVSFDSRNRVILAPWAQKNKPRKPQFVSEARNSKNSSEEGKRVDGYRGHFVQELKNLGREVNYDGNFGGIIGIDASPIGLAEIKVSSSSVQESKILDRGLNYDAKPEGGRIEIDATPIGLSEIKVSSSIVQDSKNLDRELNYDGRLEGGIIEIDASPIGFDESVSLNGIDQEIYSGEGVSDKCNSMRLPYERKSDVLRERLPWERESDVKHVEGDNLRESNTIMAEKLIPESELKRLRNVSLRMLERMKVGAAGITQALVNSIHEKWKDDEVVKLKFEGPSAINMKRSHEILENRTGGLVIWRSGSSVVLFRGMTYKLQCVQSYTKQSQANMKISQSSEDLVNDSTQIVGQNASTSSWESSTTDSARYLKDLSKKELVDLSELNLLLDELGPRFKDWSGRDPLPVDADLLPSVVQGYKRPFRLLPYGTRHGLLDKEMTFYRRTARTMPPHFALGRNRELQGLAMAMVKLWRRSAIAKIAIKRGVHNTCNERMAEELKRLTGGTLVSRNKDYIVFYRGNDFLPPGVTNKLVEAQKLAALQQDEEDQARHIASTLIESNNKAVKGPLVAGTLAETMAATSRWRNEPSNEEREKMMRDLALARHASLVKFLGKKLAHANGKVKKAEKALEKVQEYLEPADLPTDLETLTDEERFLFRKIGLSMKPYLLLGRRGIFDGTVENMHLHWKYRELVKIIVGGKRFSLVKHVAISLEAESGGVLVSVDKTTKGYAIIVYRGKNYQRPCAFRPKNLLSRRQALARSIELQRREGLKHHISELQERIEKLKSELEDMKTLKEIDEETLYSRVDNASDNDDDYDDEDEDNMEEDEDEEAYLEIYDSDNEDGNRARLKEQSI